MIAQAFQNDGLLTDDQVRQTLTAGLERQFTNQRVLVLIPDHTRTIPLPFLFRELVAILHDTKQLDFMVAIDIYVNETTRHAHIILPPTTGLETSHYDLAFHVLAVQNTAKYSPALFAPEPDMRHDWQIFQALRAHLEAGEGEPPRRDKGDVFQRRPETILDLGLRYGPYGSWGGRRGRADGLNLAKLKRQPHGVDLGALRSCMPARLYTPTHRIELAPELFVADMARLAAHFFGGNAGREHTFDLALIGRRQLRSNNSWMHNSHRLVKGKERCTLLLHPEDAAVRGLQTGDMALVCSRVGQVRAQVAVSDEVIEHQVFECFVDVLEYAARCDRKTCHSMSVRDAVVGIWPRLHACIDE